MGGSNISAENIGPPLQMRWSVILIAFKSGIKYFRGIQKFQAKVVQGFHYLGRFKYIATIDTIPIPYYLVAGSLV